MTHNDWFKAMAEPEADGGGRELLLIFADWLEDRGEIQEANDYRAIYQSGYFPDIIDRNLVSTGQETLYYWYEDLSADHHGKSQRSFLQTRQNETSWLPQKLFRRVVEGPYAKTTDCSCLFPSLYQAISGLRHALKQEVVRTTLWVAYCGSEHRGDYQFHVLDVFDNKEACQEFSTEAFPCSGVIQEGDTVCVLVCRNAVNHKHCFVGTVALTEEEVRHQHKIHNGFYWVTRTVRHTKPVSS